MFCDYIIETSWLIFSSEIPALFYYSHILTAFVTIFLGFFVFINNKKSLASKIFLLTNISYALLMFLNLILWTNSHVPTIILSWPLTQILGVIMPIFLLYFFYVFINKKDVAFRYKIFWSLIISSLIVLAFSKLNFNSFDIVLCEPITSDIVFNSQNIIFVLVFISLFYLFIKKILIKTLSVNEKKEYTFLFLGLSLFLISYIIIWQFAEFYDSFTLEQYGLFGMVLLMAIVSFIIVRFKAFNIKLLGAQALVWSMVILIGSQFLFIQSTVNKVLNSVTFVAVSVAGLILVRSVKKVDQQRELLDIANRNQQSLLHFITHQVKGFMTKSRNIFSGMLEGDYGEINGKVREIAKYGMDSETKGVMTVQSILQASDLKNGVVEFIKKEFDLTALIKGIIEDSRKKIQEKGLELEENISIKPIMFNGDEMKLKEVFKNILDNSILYTPEGKITVTLKGDREKIKISIKDTGIGLTSDDKQDLFKEGGRGKDSLTHNIDSTGYGLYITKQIVKEHKGHVWAESEGRDKGSEFIIELPKN